MPKSRSFPLPGDGTVERPAMPWGLTHLLLQVRLDLSAGAVEGAVTWTCAARRAEPGPLVLDAFAIDVAKVVDAAGADLDWSNDGAHLEIQLPSDSTLVRIEYAATPQRGLWFCRPDDDYPDRPVQVWSQGQDQDHHHWFPCLDHPSIRFSQDVEVTVDAGLTVLSNGHQVSRQAAGEGLETHKWRLETPHVTYLLSVVAGQLTRLDLPDGPAGVDVYALVSPGQEAQAAHNLRETGAMMRFMGEYLDTPYPYEQYAQVCVTDFIFGGMENTTATTLTERTLHPPELEDDYSSQPLVAHELAHQWFGDLISVRDWPHAWLHEGFATFFDLAWHEHSKGRDEFHHMLKEEAEGYLAEDSRRYRRSIVTHTRAAPIDIFDAHLYNKGAWVVHMLRGTIGESAFRKGLATYLERHARGNVVTWDLQRAMEDASGLDLRWFFSQWIEKAGHPDLAGSVTWEADSGEVVLKLRQQQATDELTPLFRLRLELRMAAGDQVTTETITVDAKESTYRFRPGFRPERVVLDPGETTLKVLSLERPPEWIRRQLAEEPEAAARARAAGDLVSTGHPGVVADLAAALANDPFHGVRQAAAAALRVLCSEAARTALIGALGDPHPRVRRAVCAALGGFLEDAVAATALLGVIEAEASDYVVGAACSALGATRDPRAIKALKAAGQRESHNAIIARGAVTGLVGSRSEEGVRSAMTQTRRGLAPPLRWQAAVALGQARELREEVREHLERCLDEPDFRLREQAATALGSLGEQEAIAALQRRLRQETDARVCRMHREAIRRLGEDSGASDEIGRLKDELAGLQALVGKLTDRLDRLEPEG